MGQIGFFEAVLFFLLIFTKKNSKLYFRQLLSLRFWDAPVALPWPLHPLHLLALSHVSPYFDDNREAKSTLTLFKEPLALGPGSLQSTFVAYLQHTFSLNVAFCSFSWYGIFCFFHAKIFSLWRRSCKLCKPASVILFKFRFVTMSWVSFFVPPDIVPARCIPLTLQFKSNIGSR